MRATLFAVPGSHPSLAAELMLRHKRLPYRRVDLLPTAQRAILPLLGFPGGTVPALRVAGRRVQGTARIAAALDELRPEPPLHPSGPAARAAVERAERWADATLQALARRLGWWALRHDRAPFDAFAADARIPKLAVRGAAPLLAVAGWRYGGSDERMRADLAALPDLLDAADALIAAGTIGGEPPNVADFQVATSVRALLAFDDLRAELDGRPAAHLARRLVPHFPGRFPPTFPPDALAQLAR